MSAAEPIRGFELVRRCAGGPRVRFPAPVAIKRASDEAVEAYGPAQAERDGEGPDLAGLRRFETDLLRSKALFLARRPVRPKAAEGAR